MLRAASSSFATFSPSDAEKGITTEELDFILNYDTRLRLTSARQVKCRLGCATETEAE